MRAVLTIADPVAKFDPIAETSSHIIMESNRRGDANWLATPDDLFIRDATVFVSARPVTLQQQQKIFSYELGAEKIQPVKDFALVWLRKDPPVDLDYWDHLTLLELVEAQTGAPLFFNSPRGIKRAYEKILPLYFSGLFPPTLVAKNPNRLEEFIQEFGQVVLKPLNLSGGRGIELLSSTDGRRREILAQATKDFAQFVVLQKFLPEAEAGDKRILLFKGKVLGSFLRVPKAGDFRGNVHSGATPELSPVSAREQMMLARIIPWLEQAGLHFVGLDVIGSFVTEINVTSPMGLREINQLTGQQTEKELHDMLK